MSTGGHTYSPDEEAIFQSTRSLLRGERTIDVTEDNAPVTSHHRLDDGRIVTAVPLAQPIVAVPGFLAGKAVSMLAPASQRDGVVRLFTLFTNSLVTAGVAVMVLLLAQRLGAARHHAALLALAYALGTMAWAQAKTLFSEPLTALLVAAAALAAMRVPEADEEASATRRAAVAGLLAGGALFSRPPAALFLLPLGVYLVVSARRRRTVGPVRVVGAFAVGVAPMLALFALGNWWRYGSPFDPGYQDVPLDFPVLEALQGFLFSPGKSIFLYAPIVFVGVLAIPRAVRRYPAEVALLLSMVLLNLLFFSRFRFWHGDNAWGPRYLQLVLPLLVVLVAPVLERRPWRRAAAGATAVGIAVPGLLGAAIYFNQYFAYVDVDREVGHDMVRYEPRYREVMHWEPQWSPLVGHAHLLDDAASTTADRLTGDRADAPPFPATTWERYGWYYARPVQLDAWWAWLPVVGLPAFLLVLVPVFAALPVVALVRGRRLWSAP